VFNLGAFEMVREVARVLRPGGRAYVSEFGGPEEHPTETAQLDHPEVSIHFGQVAEAAVAQGLVATLCPLADLLGVDREARWLSRPSYEAIRAWFASRGEPLAARAYHPGALPEGHGFDDVWWVSVGKDGPGPDGMSIYTGSCGFGQNLGNHFVSAWQTDGGYDWGLTDKCGQCYEVLCVDGQTRGLDWSDLGPWGGCVEPGRKSVTVKISDSCPCHHPNAGNKRWCCGDVVHLDLSYIAFDAIALRHRGVVDLKVRPADCGKQGVVAFYQ